MNFLKRQLDHVQVEEPLQAWIQLPTTTTTTTTLNQTKQETNTCRRRQSEKQGRRWDMKMHVRVGW